MPIKREIKREKYLENKKKGVPLHPLLRGANKKNLESITVFEIIP
jgi:hypothetical protein